MLKQIILSTIIVALALSACKTAQKTNAKIVPPVQDTLTDLSNYKLIKDKELYTAITELIPLDTALINKDTLHIYTKKIGACDAENFKLFWNGSIAKSLPPQVTLKLFERVDPACKELHNFHLTFNLAPLKLKSDTVEPTSNQAFKKAVLVRITGIKGAMRYEY